MTMSILLTEDFLIEFLNITNFSLCILCMFGLWLLTDHVWIVSLLNFLNFESWIIIVED